ncbi:hypothetical protein K439DRAFT_560742 [Ramaria rubella]|nr:hypothetical protein K439DRAFT_560742 [Ramaria rubella]
MVVKSAKLPSLAKFDNTVYLIRHGEKPADGGQGLDPQGEERAQCLTGVFSPSSPFDIGYILAEMPQSNGDRTRPLMTVTPLAEELGLTVDTSCDRNDSDCVADAVVAFAKNNTSNILICWEHGEIKDIMKSMNVKKPPSYPSDAFNLIFTVQDQKFISQTSENCTGLDNTTSTIDA